MAPVGFCFSCFPLEVLIEQLLISHKYKGEELDETIIRSVGLCALFYMEGNHLKNYGFNPSELDPSSHPHITNAVSSSNIVVGNEIGLRINHDLRNSGVPVLVASAVEHEMYGWRQV